jgi:hypothetical protein
MANHWGTSEHQQGLAFNRNQKATRRRENFRRSTLIAGFDCLTPFGFALTTRVFHQLCGASHAQAALHTEIVFARR